jgi:hypothetical protein
MRTDMRVRDKERDALIKRINRVLKATGRVLRVMHRSSNVVGSHRLKTPYYIENLTLNPDPFMNRMQVAIDITALGKELGVAKAAAAGN